MRMSTSMPGMANSNIELLKKGLMNPKRASKYVARKFGDQAINLYGAVYQQVHRHPKQLDLIHEFVDGNDEFVLVVLDACRYDIFQSSVADYLEGENVASWSPGSLTPEWGPKVWKGQFDLTYISSNPIIGNFEYSPRNNDFGYQTFCAADHVSEFIDVYNFGWDEEDRTVRPEVMTDTALKVAARDDPTRMVVHYLQPHLPFVGENGFSMIPLESESDIESTDLSYDERVQYLEETSEITVREKVEKSISWQEELEYNISVVDNQRRGYRPLLEQGLVDKSDIKDGYVGNLELALTEVQRLVKQIDCPIVVTADHGELLGEWNKYEHPPLRHPTLRVVPWFKVDSKEVGREENDHSPLEYQETDIDTEAVERRLESLGYV